MVSAPAFAMTADADADGPFTVTDGTGYEVKYTEPAKKIITLGYAYTLTVTMLGGIDKIIATDSFSTYSYTEDERLKDLSAKNLGSSYSIDTVKNMFTQFLQWVDEGYMTLDDTIIMTKYNSTTELNKDLKKEGFSKVLMFDEITDYDEIVKLVESLSMITTGKINSIVDDMRFVKEQIQDGLKGIEHTGKGMGLWYVASTETFTIHNYGSITVSLIESAGGTNIGKNDNGSRRYGDITTVLQLMENNMDTVIFLPDNYLKENSMEDFKTKYLPKNEGITLIHVKQSWNNYCPDAMNGLWAFACAMYPDVFGGDIPHTDPPSDSNLPIYITAGLAFALVIVIAGYFFLRKP